MKSPKFDGVRIVLRDEEAPRLPRLAPLSNALGERAVAGRLFPAPCDSASIDVRGHVCFATTIASSHRHFGNPNRKPRILEGSLGFILVTVFGGILTQGNWTYPIRDEVR